MTHATNLAKISSYLDDAYTREETRGVPKRSDLTFANTIKRMPHAVVMYVDMRGSRRILMNATSFWSVKVHRAFLQAIVYCVENREGHFRSFNGDGALAFFVGENAASRAVKAAMDLKAYVIKINELTKGRIKRPVDFEVGIGQGAVDVAKSGKRGEDATKQDLIWIGTPVYVAVELSDFAKKPNNIWISPHVRKSIGKQNHLKVVLNKDGKSIWVKTTKKLKSVGETKFVARATRQRSPSKPGQPPPLNLLSSRFLPLGRRFRA
jgi:adenylate cyclase